MIQMYRHIQNALHLAGFWTFSRTVVFLHKFIFGYFRSAILLGLVLIEACALDQGEIDPPLRLAINSYPALMERGGQAKESDLSLSQTLLHEGKTPLGNSPLSLRELVPLVVNHNPAIRAAHYEWQKAIEKYPQVVSLPDPTLTYSYPLQHAKTRADMEQNKVTFMQEIPFPYKLYLEGEVVKDDVRLARLAYERVVRDTVVQVQRSFYELMYLQAAVEITHKNQDLLRHIVKVAEVEVGAGRAVLPDLLRAQSQLAQLDYDLIRLEELRQTEIGQLNALLDQKPQTSLSLSMPGFPKATPMPEFEKIYEYALQNRQELMALQVELERADHEVSLAFSEYFPDLSVGFSWTQVERDKMLPATKEGSDEWMLMFGVTLPIWFPKRNARIREARLSMRSVEAMKRDVENQLAAALKRVYYKTTNANRLVELYEETLLPQAQKSMSIGERWHREGQGSFLGFLDAQSIFLNFSLSLARSRADYAQSLAELAQLSGGTLPVALFAAKKSSQGSKEK